MTARLSKNAMEKSGILPVYFSILPNVKEQTEAHAPKQMRTNPTQFTASGHVTND